MTACVNLTPVHPTPPPDFYFTPLLSYWSLCQLEWPLSYCAGFPGIAVH